MLEKITLIKDISLSNPHIAHIKNLESIASIAHREVDEYYKAILEALSIEKLNDRFFREITGHFLDFCENITLPVGSGISKDIDSNKREFVLRLISRILFCKFLEKKSLVDSRLLDSVPYLNGGLFAPQDRDFYKLDSSTGISAYINTLKIPDECFKNLFKTLESYHFTLDENTPLNQEVGLDPELLGMVFENLLSVLFTDNKQDDKNLRKATGSYYTPREIVSYMCKSALLESLHTKCQDVSYEELKELIFEPESEVQQNPKAKAILPHLATLKILDPACGSGAFPMGMLHEILTLQDKLDDKQNTSLYERKLKILQNNIYGIDLQPMATEIARLRCFLSLICDAPSENITPLPNLDFKFISANSLIPLPQQQGLQYAGYEEDLKELKALRESTFSAQNKSEIESQYLALRDKIARQLIFSGDSNPILEWNLFDPHSVAGFFDSEWMFGIKAGQLRKT